MLRKGFIGTRIYLELKKIGYKGSLSSLYRFLKDNKLEKDIKNLSTTRFETLPGKQMQYDWTEWTLLVNGNNVKIYIHEVILSYSRKKFHSVKNFVYKLSRYYLA